MQTFFRRIFILSFTVFFIFKLTAISDVYNYLHKSNFLSIIPIHKGKDIKPKTLYGIISDMGLKPEELKELL